jgi:hypothetical protein
MGTQLDLFARKPVVKEPHEPHWPDGHPYPDESDPRCFEPSPLVDAVSAMTEIVQDLGIASENIGSIRDELAERPRDPNDPEEPYCLADELMEALGKMNERAERDLQELRALHAKILGCSVDELDAVVAKQEAERKAERAAAKVSRQMFPAVSSGPPTNRRRTSKVSAPRVDEDVQPMRRLTPRQQELLGCLVIEEDRAVFGPDQHIPDWPTLKHVMLLLGATWKTGGKRKGGTKRKGAFVFPEDMDPEETLWLARERGEIFDPKLVGTFLTPDALADYAASKLDLAPNMRVLEPSAGRGSIAKAVLRACPEVLVECVELLDVHHQALRSLGLPIIGTDFLALRPEDHTMFDACGMNPPFNRGAECHHVLHAARFVRPGGKLVSIVSPGMTYRKTAPYMDLAAWLQAHGTIEELPDGSFAESGTNIRTVLITARVCDGCRNGGCWK